MLFIIAVIQKAFGLCNMFISIGVWLMLVEALAFLALGLLLYCVCALINVISRRHCKLKSGKNKP